MAVLAILVVGYTLGASGLELRSPIGSSGETEREDKTRGSEAPSEFLFLDVDRVTAYLAQLEGGAFAKQRLSQKATNTVSGELPLDGGKIGGSSSTERFVEREVTPTAASSFVELEKQLEDRVELKEESLSEFERNFAATKVGCDTGEDVRDGDFVRFEAIVTGPIYLDPYIAATGNAQRTALLPRRARTPAGRAFLAKQRNAVRPFVKQVGDNPRAILAIEAPQTEGQEMQCGKEKPKPAESGDTAPIAKYLMPVHLKQLSEERSLLRTGGVFTVVGKVVRIFKPEEGASASSQNDKQPPFAYIDTQTRQTWRNALRNAPGELICRSNLACARELEGKGGLQGSERRDWIADTRAQMLAALHRETEIAGDGALIVPVAIYR